jgi:hypothetical protein
MRICEICNSNNDLLSLAEIECCLPSNIDLDGILKVNKCIKCNFYFSDNNNTQDDYNNYYISCNNYTNNKKIISDKDMKCYKFLTENLDINLKILDYGSGNGILYSKMMETFLDVNQYDIGMKNINDKYDCIIISHVLEHIFDINLFIKNIDSLLNDNKDSMIYIEVPNAEYYDKFNIICPLQEINIEHINYFTKFSLNKLMLNHGYISKLLIDDFFYINYFKYYVIRGIFTKYRNTLSFENYLQNGLTCINNIKYEEINNLESIYIYGCGQFLFKVIKNIKTKIINVIDDNITYYNHDINCIKIINFEDFKNKVKDNDNILIITALHSNIIKEKLSIIDKKINILILDLLTF